MSTCWSRGGWQATAKQPGKVVYPEEHQRAEAHLDFVVLNAALKGPPFQVTSRGIVRRQDFTQKHWIAALTQIVTSANDRKV